MRLKDLCNSTNLSEFVTIQNPVVKVISNALVCTMPKEKLASAEEVFQANLDIMKPIMVSGSFSIVLFSRYNLCTENGKMLCCVYKLDFGIHGGSVPRPFLLSPPLPCCGHWNPQISKKVVYMNMTTMVFFRPFWGRSSCVQPLQVSEQLHTQPELGSRCVQESSLLMGSEL